MRFPVDGSPVDVPLPDGSLAGRPVTRADYRSLVAAPVVMTARPGRRIRRGRVLGVAVRHLDSTLDEPHDVPAEPTGTQLSLGDDPAAMKELLVGGRPVAERTRGTVALRVRESTRAGSCTSQYR